MSEPKDIFISYRRSDTLAIAISLRYALQSKFPSSRLFYAGTDIKAGADWPDRLREGLQGCAVLIALIGKKWAIERDEDNIRRRLDIEEDWVRNEIAHALEQGKHVIPVLVDGAELPNDERSLPKCLRDILNKQCVKIREDGVMQDIDSLVDDVQRLLPDSARATAPTAPEPAQPANASEPDTIPVTLAASLIAEAADGGETLSVLGKSQYDAERYALSHAILTEAVDILTESHGPEDPWTLAARHNCASALINLGRTEEAERAFRKLLPQSEKIIGAEHPETLVSRHEYARALLDFGRTEEAEKAFRDLLPLNEKVNGPEHSNTLATLRLFALSLLEQGEADRAAETLASLPVALHDQDNLELARNAMLHGWLADLNGNAPKADALCQMQPPTCPTSPRTTTCAASLTATSKPAFPAKRAVR